MTWAEQRRYANKIKAQLVSTLQVALAGFRELSVLQRSPWGC